MRFFPIFLIALGFTLINARAESPIDFSKSDNLKAVYDAGFRPWRNGPDSCHLDHVKVTVIVPGGAQFSIPAEMVDFSVLAENKLSSAHFVGEVMSTDETISKLREICNTLGLPINGLDQFASTFTERNPKSVVWNTRGKKGDISIFVSTDRLDFVDRLGAEIYITLQWKRIGTPMKFLISPVQPPPGYENESMAPPKVNPNQKGFPEHDMQYYKDLIAKKKAEDGNSPATASPSQTPTPVVPTPQVQPTAEPSLPFWVYGIGLIILGAIVALWYRFRPKQ